VDEATVGARLRTLRRWRGMTLAEVSGLAGVSLSYLAMVERGERMLDRRSYISAVAAALKVSETDLVGGPHLSADRQQSDPHMAIPALREALQTNTLTAPAIDRARPLAELASQVTERVLPLRVRCKYAELGAILPAVIDELHWHTALADEAPRRQALETLIEACVAATDMCSVLGYKDLAHITALRAEGCAALLDDPVHQGKAAVLRLFAYPRERSWERRLTTAERAADALQPHATTPLAYQVLGMLTLHAALAASVLQRPHLIAHWLDEASRLAERVPDDVAGNWHYFSATNVAIWRLAISVERGEVGKVLNLASMVSDGQLTVRSRKADFLTDVGRGLARDPKTRAEAVRWLRRAEETAPQRVRNNAAFRETVAYLLGRATASAVRELRGMATRMGVPH
jgi:transcriptional regulator with XRE-family HTH domain